MGYSKARSPSPGGGATGGSGITRARSWGGPASDGTGSSSRGTGSSLSSARAGGTSRSATGSSSGSASPSAKKVLVNQPVTFHKKVKSSG